MLKILEELTVFTPLGIRFWDPVIDAQIRDGLEVEARPDPGFFIHLPGSQTLSRSGFTAERRSTFAERWQRPVARARRSAGDVYVFHGLPGLLGVEYRLPETAASPPSRRRFVVEVRDARRRYLPVAFRVELPLPYRGVFLAGTASSPIEASPPGLLLFAGPNRPRAPWLAVVRGELVDLAVEAPRPTPWCGSTSRGSRSATASRTPRAASQSSFPNPPRSTVSADRRPAGRRPADRRRGARGCRSGTAAGSCRLRSFANPAGSPASPAASCPTMPQS